MISLPSMLMVVFLEGSNENARRVRKIVNYEREEDSTRLSVTASYNGVIARGRSTQSTIVTFDVMLFAKCDLSKIHQ